METKRMNSDTEARDPVTTLAEFSSENAVATTWARGRKVLDDAEVYWVSSVRPDGRPHVTPLLGIWLNGAMYFCTGDDERKAKNLAENSHCILTTGCNNLDGLDVVVEGDVEKVSDDTELQSAANAYESKYGRRFTAPEGTWFGLGDSIRQSEVLLYPLTPARALGFAKGGTFSQTRWTFS
jgi:nitroimidazol reductase NimA-like FMN-containing flavoprotein (pyridoxamine 5'-phosphate oxidase superfamily)